MLIQFSKMHGLGNDFVVVDGVTQKVFFNAETLKRLGDRHFGIGFDQLLLVEPPYDPDLDFHYRIFNADGSEVQQCGNGARCFARFVRLKGLTNKDRIAVSTVSGRIVLQLEDNDQVTVNMGVPEFEPAKIPFRALKAEKLYPHCELEVPSVKTAPVETLGPKLESFDRFPERVNVGFMEVVNANEINLRVYERGAGETMACGTGACAAVVVGIQQGKLRDRVKVNLPGGSLSIAWNGPGTPVYMTGPAEHVFDGQIEL